MHQSLKFHYTNQRQEYEFKWLELQNYFNKINKVVYCLEENQSANIIDLKTHLTCYIRIDFGLKNTKIYTTNEKIPSLFADYITLNYCDHFVMSWILSWFGCSHLQQFMTYCKKYGSVLEELTCLGASFNIFKGTIKKVTLDGNQNGISKRIELGWKKSAYKFLTQGNTNTQAHNDLTLHQAQQQDREEQEQIQREKEQVQEEQVQYKQHVRIKIKLKAKT